MRIGGVPEHYNAPVHKAIEKSREDNQIDWITYPSGTGAMLEALDRGELDMAILLTEGAVKHALTSSQNPSVSIMGTFVDSPLPWGVHVSATGRLQSLSDVNDNIDTLTFGISRMGSGSHLMGVVHASTLNGKRLPRFSIVNTMAGARDAMAKGEIDVFLWDITTADVYAREGVWKCIGTVSGNWPAFVFAVRSDTSPVLLEKLSCFIDLLRSECAQMKANNGSSVAYLVDKYSITEEQASEFIKRISWNSSLHIDQSALERVVTALRSAGVLPKLPAYAVVDLHGLIVAKKSVLVYLLSRSVCNRILPFQLKWRLWPSPTCTTGA